MEECPSLGQRLSEALVVEGDHFAQINVRKSFSEASKAPSDYVFTASQPPLVKTQTVTISDPANAMKSEIPTKDVPIVHTETKTITYEAAQVGHGFMLLNRKLE